MPLPYLLITLKATELSKVYLRIFLNTLTADDPYFLFNRYNLTPPVQIHLSKNQEILSQFFSAFLKSRLCFEYFQIKDGPYSLCISEFRDSKRLG